MFKVGDIVRCKTDRYGITTYKRPCEVVGILSDDKIDIRCLGGDGSNGVHVSHPAFWKDFIFYDDIRYIKKFTV